MPKKSTTPRHSADLGEFLICRCRDPFCDGTDADGKLKPERPPSYVSDSESGTFRATARARIDARTPRRYRRRG